MDVVKALRDEQKAAMRPRFDTARVRSLAGDQSFARGEAYHREGKIAILSLSTDRVLATAAGTEDYRVELSGQGRTIGGSCTCRAFEDYGFCKHMVAVALAANAAERAGNGGEDALGRIRAHLKALGKDALVDMIAELAERDPTLFRRLDSAAAVVSADDKTLEARLRKAIDQATRTGGYLEYGAVGGWASGVEAVLDTIAGLASGARARLALGLVEHALRRIEKAVESLDDSDGHVGALLERARDIHLTAAKAARPDPVKLARDLFARETNGILDTFHGSAEIYEDALGDAGLAEYRRLAAEAWSKLPARMGKRGVRQADTFDDFRIAAILDRFAEQDGDVDARITIRAKDLSSPWRYLQLAQFCREQGAGCLALRRGRAVDLRG